MPPLKSQRYPHDSMIHLELQPEIEAQLTAEAEVRGLVLDRYIETIVVARALASCQSQRWMKHNSPAICNRASAR